ARPATPPAQRPAEAAQRPAEPRAAVDNGQYTVERGDTLTSIANAVRGGDVTQEQMVAALYQGNSAAFTGKNINRLREGRVLRVPDAATAQQISPKEARQIILRASNFDSYRQSVAAAAAAGPARSSEATQSGGGAISPKVQETAPQQAQSRDQLRISKTQVAPTGTATPDNARVQSLEEDVASRDKALKEANSRVADLEKNVAELQKLIDLKSQSLADLQKQASAAEAAKAATPPAAPAPAAAAPAESAPTPHEAPAVTESTPAPALSGAPASAPKAAAAPEIKETIEPAPEGESFFTSPLALAAIAIALLGAGLVAVRNRRRQPQTTGLTQASLSELSTSPNSVFGNAGGQTIDTGTSVLHTDFSQSGLSAIDTDEGVDPVAEADVYMAYGRDAQAEEILLDALKTDPTRTPIYLKLLEIYAQRGSAKQFENVASDLYAQTGGAGDDWAKAVAMGLRIDPTNPLYQSTSAARTETGTLSAAAPAVAVAAAAATSPLAAEESPTPAVTFGTEDVSQMRATWTVPGELNQFTDTSVPVAPLAAANAATATSPDLNLDFNLDLELPEEEQAARAAAAGPSFVASSLDFEPRATAEPVAPAKAGALEFDLPSLDTPNDVLKGAADVPADIPPLAFETPKVTPADVHSTEFDIGIERALQQTSTSVVDLETTNFEGNLLDFDFELGDDKAAAAPADRSVDLTGVNLRNDFTGTGVASVQHEAVDTAAMDEDIDIDDEVSTKLELARAYEEMGDVEGARELLEEVVNAGSGSQQDQARSMLSRIS
ncbi:MAG: FimV/HubP family polar landmark protein, partial [Rhodocyclaceae bacterium]